MNTQIGITPVVEIKEHGVINADSDLVFGDCKSTHRTVGIIFIFLHEATPSSMGMSYSVRRTCL